jgi:pimeloyl-ACP methyl ester carboxylesterase
LRRLAKALGWQQRWQRGNTEGVATRADRGAGCVSARVEVRRAVPRRGPAAQGSAAALAEAGAIKLAHQADARVVGRCRGSASRGLTATRGRVDDPISSRVGQVAAPTLVIHGTEDALFAYGHQYFLLREGEVAASEPGRLQIREVLHGFFCKTVWSRSVGGRFACDVCLSRGRGLRAAGEARVTGAT